MTIFFRVLVTVLFLSCLGVGPLEARGQDTVRIGVLAFRPKPQTLAQWRPLEAALKRSIADRHFVIEALTYQEMDSVVQAGTVDFVLTNPAHYVQLRLQSRLSSPVATLATLEQGGRYTQFGGVIFTAARTTSISTLSDLKGKTIAATANVSTGGYLTEAFELSLVGVHMPGDATLLSTGMPHDKVVDAVLSGSADAGFVRTGVLEGMAAEGKLDLKKIKVINQQHPEGFSPLISTRLYPEWPFASMSHVDERLARHVAAALFLLEEDSAAARALGIHGFVVPADYTPVEDMLRELRLPPFEDAPQFTQRDVWDKYRVTIIGALFAGGVILLLAIRLQLTNRKLSSEQRLVKLQEQAIRESEERYRSILEMAPIAIAVHAQGKIVFMNPAGISLLGAGTVNQVIGMSIADIIHPDSLHTSLDRIQRMLAGETGLYPTEDIYIRLDGEQRNVELMASQLTYGNELAVQVIVTDITARKRIEVELKHHMDELLAWHRLTIGRESRVMELKNEVNVLLAQLNEPARYNDQISLSNADTVQTLLSEHELSRRALLGILEDEKRAKDALRESEAFRKRVFDASRIPIVVMDAATNRYIDCNAAAVRIYKYASREEILGRVPEDFSAAVQYDGTPSHEQAQAYIRQALADGSILFEWRHQRPDGDVWDAEVHLMSFLAGERQYLQFTLQDITERKRAREELHMIEKRLRQSEKMEAIGQLAGGIAHDFNNVLGGIVGYTDLSLGFAEKGSILEKNLLKVLQASERAKQLVKQILTFSRQGNPQKTVTSIAPIVQEVLELLRASIPSSIIIESDLSQDVKPVLADATKIHEVMLNLATNAVHAMNGKGVLSVDLHPVHLETAAFGVIGEILPGEYAVIDVKDNGCGMDEATLSNAFNPFFTTKAVGQGTGMGLSVVLGVVQSHEGDLMIESTPGNGTTIRVFLPVSEVQHAVHVHDNARALLSGTERILFVDDEQMLVDMNAERLSLLGYSVIAKSDSTEALEYIREHGTEIDLLITDMTMPGFNGIDLARAVLALRKSFPIILCTGFSTEADADRAAAIGIKRIVMKPYRSDEISKAIRDVLDGPMNG